MSSPSQDFKCVQPNSNGCREQKPNQTSSRKKKVLTHKEYLKNVYGKVELNDTSIFGAKYINAFSHFFFSITHIFLGLFEDLSCNWAVLSTELYRV